MIKARENLNNHFGSKVYSLLRKRDIHIQVNPVARGIAKVIIYPEDKTVSVKEIEDILHEEEFNVFHTIGGLLVSQ